MEAVVYILAGLLTMSWSVSLYIYRTEKLKQSAAAPVQALYLLYPSLIFLGLIFNGAWANHLLRLDITGLVLQSVILMLALAVWLILLTAIRKKKQRRRALNMVWLLFCLLSLVNLVGHLLIRRFPAYLIVINDTVETLKSIDLFTFSWLFLSEQTEESRIITLINRLFIAALSYLPIFLLRFFMIWRKTRVLQKEVSALEQRVAELERRGTDAF